MYFNAAFKFFRHEPRTLQLHARLIASADGVTAECRLIGTHTVPAQAEPQTTVHFTGRVRLSRLPLKPERAQAPVEMGEQRVGARDIYRVYFHGPAYRVLGSAWRHDGKTIGRLAANLPPQHVPAARPTLASPRLIELCFQTAGLWDLGLNGRLSLPHHVDRVTIFEPGEPADTPLLAVVRPDEVRTGFDADVVDGTGRVFVRLRGYRTVEVPGGFDSAVLEPLRASMAPTVAV